MNKLIIRLLLLAATLPAYSASQTTTIDVVAVEYPPFTTLLDRNGGIAFQLLHEHAISDHIKWRPYFLPPARAAATIETKDWCASFFPPVEKSTSSALVLSESEVHIGLIRAKQQQPFTWKSLNDLAGKTVALLRNNDISNFHNQFTQAGLSIIHVESIEAGMQMVLRGRAEFAMSDNITFNALEKYHRAKVQFSENYLVSTPITLYINNNCDLSTSVLSG